MGSFYDARRLDAHIEGVALGSAGVVAALQGLLTSCLAGKGRSPAAVLEGRHMAAVTGHRQHLLAGRACCGGLPCRLHCYCHLYNALTLAPPTQGSGITHGLSSLPCVSKNCCLRETVGSSLYPEDLTQNPSPAQS